MLRHPVKKVFGLTILYSLIIIGIFVLQFKNESVLSRNIGLLSMSVAQTQDAAGNTSLKNTMQVSFKGISFTADDVTPAVLTLETAEQKNLVLQSWEQPTPLSYTFFFSDDTALTFVASDTSPKASLSVLAQLPPHAESLSLLYKTASGYAVTEQTKTRQLVSSKNAVYTMTAPTIEDTLISFSPANAVATYAVYEPSAAFTYASVPADTPLAQQTVYAENIRKIRASVAGISAAAMQDSSQFTENAAVAYIAELASQKRYKEALNRVPESVRRSSRRTYISAPFFDSLVTMNNSLTMANDNMRGMINNALSQKNLDIFAVDGIADYLLREDTSTAVRDLVAFPAALDEYKPTITQATGIIRVYLALARAQSALAERLAPVIEPSLAHICAHSTFTDGTMQVTEKDAPLSFLQSIEIGKVLLDYGEYNGSVEHSICGRLIVNTAFSHQTGDIDIRTLTEAYPLLVTDNPFYPHYAIMPRSGNQRVWAWTSAQQLTYEETDGGRMATIGIDFPLEETHYLILRGIKPFEHIEIYGLSFHTDPRFESYNSSGYVYNAQTQTLFLKSRHKSEHEIIRLTFSRAATNE